MWTKLIFLLTAVVIFASCYPTGAPAEVCISMMPSHGVAAQNTPAPFQVSVPHQVKQGETVTVKIENSEPGFTFRGFIIQARAVETKAVVGKFLITENMKTVACPTLPVDSVATHTSPTEKSSLDLQWVAPINFSGPVVFQ